MRIDATAAYYGLFQVAFADAIEHLAGALFSMRQHNEPNLEFSDVFNQRFSDQLKGLRQELAAFKNKGPSTQEHMEAVLDACSRMDKLRIWRDSRIHPRVVLTGDGYALFDKKTGERLSISETECKEKLDELVKVIVTLEAYVPHLVGALDFDKEIEEMLRSDQELASIFT